MGKVKMYKMVVYVTDLNYLHKDAKNVVEDIEREIDFATVFPKGVVEIEWEDEIDINQIGAVQEQYERYFKE